MSSPATRNLVCPSGHGPQPVGADYCWACGRHLLSLSPQSSATISPVESKAVVQQTAPAQTRIYGGQSAPVLPPGVQTGITQPAPAACATCGGDGSRLNVLQNVCPQCRWLRPLAPGYKLDCSAFQWAQDGTAMQKLRSIGALNSAARTVSDKVGRPWIEATFNAVHVGENQLPGIHKQAILAARILNLPYLPDVYVSGERMWDAATYGSDTNSFIVLGSAVVTSFPGDDLLFLLAREMGHCRAGHALWKTVIRFLVGEQGPRSNLMSGGLLSMLSITTLVEGTLELPLLAWARQSEITADRAGLLAVRDENIVRRVLLTWSLKSALLFKQINIAEWMAQQEDTENQFSKLSELALSATPYVTRRLRLLVGFARSREMEQWRKTAGPLIEAAQVSTQQQVSATKLPLGRVAGSTYQTSGPGAEPSTDKDFYRMKCLGCGTLLRVPRKVMEGKDSLNVRCGNSKCRRVVRLKRKPVQVPQSSESAMQRETTTYAE